MDDHNRKYNKHCPVDVGFVGLAEGDSEGKTKNREERTGGEGRVEHQDSGKIDEGIVFNLFKTSLTVPILEEKTFKTGGLELLEGSDGEEE